MPNVAPILDLSTHPTLGHINIVERGLKVFDKVIVAVAINTSKTPVFNVEERVELLRKIFGKNKKIEIDTFEGLLVDYVKRKKSSVILRGVRTVADFEYELQMSFANKKLLPKLETVFIMTESHFSHAVSSSIIKELARFGGSLRDMVHPIVEKQLLQKIKRKKL